MKHFTTTLKIFLSALAVIGAVFAFAFVDGWDFQFDEIIKFFRDYGKGE
ncbi:MAG: hypothetical protein FWB93_04310 [Oscillospiraceae bacterium]|nr:hypothetical protein [Oscillospiraceae bacterium]